MSTWNNTLEARRRQKEQARQVKIDEEEQRRQVMDREEAAFQAAERKKAIQRAKTLLYENTERVKALGSKLYVSDVLKERELQMQIQSEIKERRQNEERLWHEKTIEVIYKLMLEILLDPNCCFLFWSGCSTRRYGRRKETAGSFAESTACKAGKSSKVVVNFVEKIFDL